MKTIATLQPRLASLTLGALLLAGAIHAGAQGLAMQRSVIAGGSGTSTGGAFALRGTVGQPDAGGPLTGGAFSLTGGFWALPVAVQTPGAPLLSISLTNGLVVVSWPLAGADGFVLDQTAAFGAGPVQTAWNQAPFPYQTNATHIFITTAPGGAGYYRLRTP
jgi:hypothetical protein